MPNIKILPYSNSNKQLWDDFVNKNKHTWIDTKSHWIDYFSNKFKYKNYSFFIYENDNLIGIMPLFLAKNIFFGSRLVSGPINDMGGPFLEKEDNAILNEICSYIDEVAAKENAAYAELRCCPIKLPGFAAKEEYADFSLDLNESMENLWKKMDKKLRNGIRKAQKTLTIEKSTSHDDLLTFYNLHLTTMRSLGSPPLALHFFEEAFKDAGKNMFFLFAKYEGKIICAIEVLSYNEVARHESTAYLPAYKNLQANSLLMFNAIEETKKNGCKKFLFGRTLKDGSVYDYKKRWNADELEYLFYYKLYKSKKINSDIRKSPIIHIANIVWRFMPLWASRRIGNYFRRMVVL